MSPLAKRGRAIIGAIIGVNFLLALGVIALAIGKERHDQLPRLIVKLVLNVGMMYELWLGNRWIKWLYVVGFFLASFFCLYIPPQAPMAIMLPIAILFAFAGGLLAAAPSVNAFFAWQRGDKEGFNEWDSSDEAVDEQF